DIENIFGSEDNPIVFENLAEVRKHFESKVSGINKRDWAIYRFAEELEGYPDCHVFVAVNHTVGETIDVSWAVLSKSRVPESDDMEIMDFPLISYGEDGDFEDEHQDVDDVDREDESPAEDLSENKEIEDPVEPLPTYKGHTVH
ncbi:MAG: hypothetical protein HY225_04190, partial [Candidatus Vogelbacteria bacterium]|nr:hypothetical protein [Candidatus Vogelbacteria bacterium]